MSQLNGEAARFPMPALCGRTPRSGSHFFASRLLLVAFCVGIVTCAQAQDQTETPPPPPSSTSLPVQAVPTPGLRRNYQTRRLQSKQRREAQLVTDTYSHRWEVYTGGQYMRFRPGPDVHNSGTGGWTLGATRYFTPRFGITADARGNYGNNSLGAVNSGGLNTYNVKFATFPFTIGPQYRFYGTSKWSISGAFQVGAIYGYFDRDTNGFPPQLIGLYPASWVGAGIGSIDIDYNLGPAMAIRFAPHVLLDNFGGHGNIDHNQGLLVGLVFRFGRQ